MNKNVSEVFNMVIEKLSNTERVRNGHIVVGSSNARKYRYVRDCLSNFTLLSTKRDFRELTFIDIDENFLRKYVEYLNGHNVVDKLQKLRRIFREANASTAVFDKIKIAQLQSIMEKPVDHSCISKIMSMDRSRLTAKEQLHIDLFLFGYCTGGSTINELAMLKRDNVQNGYIYCKRISSGKIAKIALCGQAIDIIDKYSNECYGEYLLPVFTCKHTTVEQQAGRVKRMTELTNQTLKKVAKTLRLKCELTMSITRRIYIELMLFNDIPFDKITKSVGCTIETITRYHEKMLLMQK